MMNQLLAGSPARAADAEALEAQASELLHGDEEKVYGDAGDQGIAKRPEMAGNSAEFRVAMRPGKRRALPEPPDGKLQDLLRPPRTTTDQRLSTHSG